MGLGTAVGQHSWFLYDVDNALHHRPGRRTEAQKCRWRKRLRHLHRSPRRAYARALTRVLDRLLERVPGGPVALPQPLQPAHHRRETIAFGRRLNALMERAFLLMVWRNFVKRRSERRPQAPTPAMVLGLEKEPRRWEEVLSLRLFPHRVDLPAEDAANADSTGCAPP